MPPTRPAAKMNVMTISPEISRLIDEIREDKTHGAGELSRQALNALKTAAGASHAANAEDLRREQEEIGSCLMSVRPSMAPVGNAVARLLASVDKTGQLPGLSEKLVHNRSG